MPDSYHTLWSTVYASWQDLAVAATVGLVSGIASYLHKLNTRNPRIFSLMEFVADTLLAGFVAIVSFSACMWINESIFHLSWWAVASVVGITSHQATRWLFIADRWLANRVQDEPHE